jgi:membrane protein DedA with SNARE-associated domain
MTFLGTLARFGLLAGLGYLGFYVYGVIMGVFSPIELIGFTIVAAVCLAAFVAYTLQLRVAMRTPGRHEALMRQAHVYRERRGF